MTTQFRSLMKSVRFFNDKFDYIIKKHENFEIIAQEYKKLVLSNKLEDTNGLAEAEMNEIKSVEVQNLFKNFNVAKEGFESSFKDIKNIVNGNYEKSQINTVKNIFTPFIRIETVNHLNHFIQIITRTNLTLRSPIYEMNWIEYIKKTQV